MSRENLQSLQDQEGREHSEQKQHRERRRAETEKPQLPPESFDAIKGSRGREDQLQMYALAKRNQELISSHILAYEPDLRKQGEKLCDCGSILIFRNYYTIDYYLLRNGFFCKQHLICPGCAIRRASVYTQVYAHRIRALLVEHPDLQPFFCTLTLRNSDDLECNFLHASKSWKKLVQNRRSSLISSACRLKTLSIFRYAQGGAGSYEVKRGKNSGEWHTHLHIVILLPKDEFKLIDRVRLDKNNNPVLKSDGTPKIVKVPIEFEDALREEWHKITGDSFIVDVCKIETEDAEVFHGAVSEVFKYAMKFQELSMEDQMHVYRTLRTRRLIYSFGLLRNVDIPDEASDLPEFDLSGLPWIEEEVHWLEQQYRLKKIRQPEEALHPDEPGIKPFSSKPIRRGKVSKITDQDIKDWMDKKMEVPF